MRAYGEQTRRLLNNPVYREVLVEVLGVGETEMITPVVEIGVTDKKSSFLNMEDMREAAEAAPAVKYAYVLERDTIMTTDSLMRLGKFEDSSNQKSQSSSVEKSQGKSPDKTAGSKDSVESKESEETSEETEEDDSLVELPIDNFPGIRTTSDFFTAYGLTAAEGFLFTQEDVDAGNLVIVLGSALSDALFPDRGAIGARVSLQFETYTVVGILEPTLLADPGDQMSYNRMAFLPQLALEKVWNKKLPITSIHFATDDSSDIQAAVNQLTAYFESAHPDANLLISTPIEKLKREQQTLSRIIAVLVFLTAVGLFIAAINLLNLMLIRIVKHTKGIGIMRALGSTRRDIFRQFMNESVLMCIAGALLGAVVSTQVYKLLSNAIISVDGFASKTFWLDLIVGAAAGLLFSLVFGLYPAFLAKETDTSAAVRTE